MVNWLGNSGHASIPRRSNSGQAARALLYEEPLPIRTTRRYFRPVTADATPAMRSERVCTIDSKIWGIDVIESKNVKVPSPASSPHVVIVQVRTYPLSVRHIDKTIEFHLQ